MPRSCLVRRRPSKLRGTWQDQPQAGFGDTACLDGSRRGRPAWFIPSNCSLPRLPVSILSGHIMLVGDSLMQYQFDALLAWAKRAQIPLQCRRANQASFSTQSSDEADRAVLALMSAANYDSRPRDCRREGLTLSIRRLNLFPPASDVVGTFTRLFESVGTNGVVIINVGLWVGRLARHRSFATGRSNATDEALAIFRRGLAALARAACSQRAWPTILWREHTPQHFSGGGEYVASSPASACRPLSRHQASAMYDKFSRPALEAIRAAQRDFPMCRRAIDVLPVFWPLVPRYRDHEGLRSSGANTRARSDCTHWLPCSGATMFLNQILVDGVVGVFARRRRGWAQPKRRDGSRMSSNGQPRAKGVQHHRRPHQQRTQSRSNAQE